MNKSIEDYRVLKIIGKGSFGTCYQVQRISSGYIYVWKEINYGQMSEENKEVLIYSAVLAFKGSFASC